jgi:hypothetical protein
MVYMVILVVFGGFLGFGGGRDRGMRLIENEYRDTLIPRHFKEHKSEEQYSDDCPLCECEEGIRADENNSNNQ